MGEILDHVFDNMVRGIFWAQYFFFIIIFIDLCKSKRQKTAIPQTTKNTNARRAWKLLFPAFINVTRSIRKPRWCLLMTFRLELKAIGDVLKLLKCFFYVKYKTRRNSISRERVSDFLPPSFVLFLKQNFVLTEKGWTTSSQLLAQLLGAAAELCTAREKGEDSQPLRLTSVLFLWARNNGASIKTALLLPLHREVFSLATSVAICGQVHMELEDPLSTRIRQLVMQSTIEWRLSAAPETY